MWELITRYDGTDWLATVASLASLYYLGNRHRSGFVYGAIAAVGWVAFAVVSGSVATGLANTIFLGMHVRGYVRWRHMHLPGSHS